MCRRHSAGITSLIRTIMEDQNHSDCHLTSVGMTTSKGKKVSVGEDEGKGAGLFLHFCQECKLVESLL